LNLVKTALTYVVVFSVGAVTSVSCFEPDLENPSFRCSPAAAVIDPDACPGDEVCCSDDAATTQGRLPNYNQPPGTQNAKYGIPIFSGDNNSLSVSGMCVKTGFDTPLVTTGCPVPCNPTWAPGDIAVICGGGVACCQVQELDPLKDCVLDPDTNLWRAVSGTDIGTPVTGWGPVHATNQDPQGKNCEVFAAGGTGVINEASLADCYDQLSVANQRGFCFKACPCIEDVCAQKNPGFVPRCGGAVAPVP
jgi:hypothetical protein